MLQSQQDIVTTILASLQKVGEMRCERCGWTRFVQHLPGKQPLRSSVFAWAENFADHLQRCYGEGNDACP